MDKSTLKIIIENLCKDIIENKEKLNSLDATIGDGDHGTNMARGSQAILDKLDTLSELATGDMINQMAMTIISTVGGASGPLYGTLLMKMAMTFKKDDSFSKDNLKSALLNAIEGVKKRGKGDYGCKTMLDVLIPVYNKLDEIKGDMEINNILTEIEDTAKAGVEYTTGIKATKGRASYLGDRSIGTADPGATSSCIIITSIINTIRS